jgi:putative spermidine/putrescine transport system ATP-binding protein
VDVGGLALVATGTGAWPAGAVGAIAVRPERIRLAPAAGGAGATENGVAGTVEECIFRGALRRYRVRLDPGRVWSVDEPATGGPPSAAPGATVRLTWRPEDCLLLPDT